MNLYEVFSNVGHVQAELGVIIACVLSWIVASTGIASPAQRDERPRSMTETIVRVIASLSIGYAIATHPLADYAKYGHHDAEHEDRAHERDDDARHGHAVHAAKPVPCKEAKRDPDRHGNAAESLLALARCKFVVRSAHARERHNI